MFDRPNTQLTERASALQGHLESFEGHPDEPHAVVVGFVDEGSESSTFVFRECSVSGDEGVELGLVAPSENEGEFSLG